MRLGISPAALAPAPRPLSPGRSRRSRAPRPAASCAAPSPPTARCRPAPRRCPRACGRRSRPQVGAVAHLDELHRDADPVAGLAHAALEHGGDAQPLADRGDVVLRALNWNDDVRATTRRPLILASTLSISSASPSEKYSSSASALRFTNGSTAIEATFSGAAASRRPALERLAQATQLVRHVERGLESLARALLQAAADDALEFGRQISARSGQRLGGVAQDRVTDVDRRLAGERPPARAQFVQEDAQREEIRRASAASPRSCSGPCRDRPQDLAHTDSGAPAVAAIVRSWGTPRPPSSPARSRAPSRGRRA